MNAITEDRSPLFAALVAVIPTVLVLSWIVEFIDEGIYLIFVGLITFGLAGLMVTASKHDNDNEPEVHQVAVGSSSSVEQLDEPVFNWWDVSISVALLLCVVSVYLIPPMRPNLISADWVQIPTLSYLRTVGAVLLASFLPGYFLLRTLDLRRQFKGLEVLLLSYLLSLFLVPVVNLVASDLGVALTSSAKLLLVALNLAVFFAFVGTRSLARSGGPLLPARSASQGIAGQFRVLQRSLSSRLGAGESRRLYFGVAVIGVFGLVLAMSYRLFPYPPYLVADQLPHHAVARLFEQYGAQVFGLRLMPYSGYNFYPRLFDIYLGTLFSVSGAPTTNTYFLINFTNVFGLLALYLLALSFLKKKNHAIALLSLVLTLFSGFGWAYELWLRATGAYSGNPLILFNQASISSYDLLFANTYFGSEHPSLTTGLQVMALPGVLALLFLTNRSDLKGGVRYVLITLLMALVFLGHVAEGGMFAAILLLAFILSGKIKGAWKVALATFTGTMLAAVVGGILPGEYYVSLGALYATLAITAVAIGVGFVRERTSKPDSSTHAPRIRLAITLTLLGLGVWTGLFLFWRLTGYSKFIVWWDCPRCLVTVPAYMYPTRFGILGLLAIPGLLFAGLVWKNRFRSVALLYAFAGTALAIGRNWMAPQLSRIAGIEEFRWNKYLALALVLPAAFLLWNGLGRLTCNRRGRRLLLASFLLAVVFTAGLASTILWAQFTSLTYTASPIPSPDRTSHTPPFEAFSLLQSHELSWGEITAIQFVADNLHSGEAVATMGSLIFPFADNYYYMRVNLLGGLLRNQTIWLVTFYALMNKSDIYQKLSAAKVRFIYLTTDDLNVLRSHEVLYAAITGLAVAFKNNQATVYSFPPQFL